MVAGVIDFQIYSGTIPDMSKKSKESPPTAPCLVCKRLPKDKEVFSRGLCSTDLKRFSRAMKSLGSSAERKAFEEEAIRRGQILESKQGRRKEGPDPFEDLAAEISIIHRRKVIQGKAQDMLDKTKPKG